MSNFSRFMKQNKIVRENAQFPATKSLLDENGSPLMWVLRPLTTKENDSIRDECMIEVPVKGKPNVYRGKLNAPLYIAKMLCACIVEPNLYDKELQDSYGVMTPEALLKEMIDDPGEYDALVSFVHKFNGFDATMDEKVAEAKN